MALRRIRNDRRLGEGPAFAAAGPRRHDGIGGRPFHIAKTRSRRQHQRQQAHCGYEPHHRFV